MYAIIEPTKLKYRRKIMKKAGKIIAIVIAAILLLVLLAVSVFSIFDRVKYREFYKHSDKAFAIGGLWAGAVQQGFDYSEELGLYVYSTYMKDHTASRIYITDNEGNTRFVELKNTDGSDHTGHVGGLSFGGDYIYVTASSKNQIIMFKVSDVLDGDGKATACGEFDVCVSSAYVYVRGNTLYTGEFYIAEDYETPKDHRHTTPAGDENTAIMAVYTLSEDGKPASADPDYVISTRGQVQGMAFDSKGRLILSTSWGLNPSGIYVYDLDRATNGTAVVDGKETPIKYVDSACLDATITAPPMAEELVYRDGKLLVMNESASMKYIFGKLTSGNHVLAYDYDTQMAIFDAQRGDNSTQTPAQPNK